MSVDDTTVLIVEDEQRMRELLSRAIASWGFDTAAARTGEEALRLMEVQPRQIVLLDLNLPGISGMDCFGRIRQSWPKTQVIILTGFGDLESARQAIHLDVLEFLSKPCHLGELEAAIGRAKLRVLETTPPAALAMMAAMATPATASEPPSDTAATLDELERQHILAALARNKGNRSDTADELGISLRTLYYRLSEYQKAGYKVEEGQ